MSRARTARLGTAQSRDHIETRERLARTVGIDADVLSEICSDCGSFYGHFLRRKRSGGFREIQPPKPLLMTALRRLLSELYKRLHVPSFLHGGIPKRSIFTHAKSHVSRRMVATLDVKDFFPTTSPTLVEPVLLGAGFRSEGLSAAIALTTVHGSLPQGSPTSSLLANFAFLPADRRILAICGSRGLTYTRYVDDITISGDCDFSELRGPISEAVKVAGYQVATDKVFFFRHSERQIVTGLIVNEKLRPTRDFIEGLKSEIRECLTVGASSVADAEGLTIQQLKSRINGRVNHVVRADRERGRKLARMLNGIDWRHPRLAAVA